MTKNQKIKAMEKTKKKIMFLKSIEDDLFNACLKQIDMPDDEETYMFDYFFNDGGYSAEETYGYVLSKQRDTEKN